MITIHRIIIFTLGSEYFCSLPRTTRVSRTVRLEWSTLIILISHWYEALWTSTAYSKLDWISMLSIRYEGKLIKSICSASLWLQTCISPANITTNYCRSKAIDGSMQHQVQQIHTQIQYTTTFVFAILIQTMIITSNDAELSSFNTSDSILWCCDIVFICYD